MEIEQTGGETSILRVAHSLNHPKTSQLLTQTNLHQGRQVGSIMRCTSIDEFHKTETDNTRLTTK
jgi:hypothetical protein